MVIGFMGTPDFAVPVLKALLDAGHRIPIVVSQPDKAKGRSKKLVPTPVKEAASAAGIEVITPIRLRDGQAEERLKALNLDMIVVAAYGQIVPPSILSLPRYGCINTHASLLPKYRGAAPIQHAILAGEDFTGVTIMKMDEGLDTGDMIARVTVPLAEDETAGSLFDRLALEAAALLVKTIPEIEKGTAVYEAQPEDSPTPYASMIRKEMAKLDFSRTAKELERVVRAMDPSPGAFTSLNGKTLKIWKSRTGPGFGQEAPGTIVKSDGSGIYVSCKEGSLILTEVQLEGKKRMPAEVFLRGNPVGSGTVLG